MKTITHTVKILILAAFMLLTKQSSSQCASSFVYSVGLGGNVTFTSTSILSNSTTTTYYWMMGNGVTQTLTGSAGMFPSYTYSVPGTYSVGLYISSTLPNCTSISYSLISVTTATGCGLSANFSYNQGSNGLVNFNNTSWGTVSGTTYSWIFGDGGTSTATSPAHTYSANGTYVAKLYANNNSSVTCVDTLMTSVVVNSYCSLAAGFTYSYMANGAVAFYNNTTPTTTATYTWNFINNSPATSNLTSPLITYSANGTYTVNLHAKTTAPSCTANATAVITVTNATGCNLNAYFGVTQGTNGAVTFINNSTGTSSTTTYSWNFGNAQTSTLSAPSITYSANGVYQVTLVVNNNLTPACTATQTMNLFVNSYCNLNASFIYTTSSSGVVTFSSTSTGAASYTPLSWSFGHSSSGNPGTSTVSIPSHTYPNGTYTVSLTLYSSSVCVSTATQVITIANYTCTLASAFTHTIGSSGLVNFANASTGTSANTTYTWNFGDGWTSNAVNPTHTYMNGGTHYVSLFVRDSSNISCTSTSTQALNITGITCNANPNFTLVPTSTPQFWTAIPSYPYNVTAAQWSWGDGNTSNGLYTSHQYSASANYTICLTVTVSCGASASTCSTYYVYKPAAGSASGIIHIDVLQPRTELETGLTDLNSDISRFTIFPNPSQGDFKLSLNESLPADSKISIYNILGEMVYLQNIDSSSDSDIEIKIPNVTTGIYFVRLESLNKTSTQKVIISK